MNTDTVAVRAVKASGLKHAVVEYGRVESVEAAAAARGVDLHQVIKTIVVRRGQGDLAMVLVPGDRVIDWPRLRTLLGVSRMALATADEAFEATGYRPGMITPLGSKTALPVIADASMTGMASIGGGAHGVAINIDASDLVGLLDAVVGEVTKEGSKEGG